MPQPITHYQVNSFKVTNKELRFEFNLLQLAFIRVSERFGIPFPMATDDPPFHSLTPFECQLDELPMEFTNAFSQDLAYLKASGITNAVFHKIPIPQERQHVTKSIARATFCNQRGLIIRLQHRYHDDKNQREIQSSRQLETVTREGHRRIISSGMSNLLMPPEWTVFRTEACPLKQLIVRHSHRLEEEPSERLLIPFSVSELQHLIEQHQQELVEFHENRGVFCNPEPYLMEENAEPADADTKTMQPEEQEVLNQLEKLTSESISTSSLVFGLAFFGFALFEVFSFFEDLWIALALIPIFLLHRTGHWVAMKLLGCQCKPMFFLPVASVSSLCGRQLNVSGWKKSLVALMGPLPGIVIAAAVGMYGIHNNEQWMIDLGNLMLFLNAIHLLPVLPFDGGEFFQVLLFYRHRYAVVAFYVVTIAILALLGEATKLIAVFWIASLSTLPLPIAYCTSEAIKNLRKHNLKMESEDGIQIPEQTALTIMRYLQENSKVSKSMREDLLAASIKNIYEGLKAKPLSTSTTWSLMILYGFTVLVSLTTWSLFTANQMGH